MVDVERLLRAYQTVRAQLLEERLPAGHWTGELASSALSTATALSALALVDAHRPEGAAPALAELRGPGLRWLLAAQNADGGWGDTDRSLSNVATTMLARAAVHLVGAAADHAEPLARAEWYLREHGGLAALRRRYGRDKTFAVPILTNAALAGLVPWDEVAPLPFELAALPQAWFRWARMPVVSYAIPALVAIGQARYHHLPPRNLLVRGLRRRAVPRTLRVLEQMQPASGGFLEATPLTSFVVMSLAGSGQANHAVVRQGVRFLQASVRGDGSWPIDTNLATWLTSLSLGALAAGGVAETDDTLSPECLDWLLGCQNRQRHPYTGAAPGGWGWSDLSGAVPDADDTPAALLVLARALGRELSPVQTERVLEAGRLGAEWLVGLQNSDGGWPTFCRGWGRLPFDRSGSDLTAHALRALHAWQPLLEPASRAAARWPRILEAGLRYLARQQRADGSWVPLWFGNQFAPEEENPVYGTARVLLAYRDLGQIASRSARRGAAWLVAGQRADGGWGGGPVTGCETRYNFESSVEETALAIEALLACGGELPLARPLERGVRWLVDRVEADRHRECAPIGFYFAKLWYYERLYPLIFATSALGQAVGRLQPRSSSESTVSHPQTV